MKHVEKFPHPGEAPPEPGPKPDYDHERDHMWNDVTYRAWVTTKTRRETYVAKLRKHIVAQALDELNANFTGLSAAERVAKALGEDFLDSFEVRP